MRAQLAALLALKLVETQQQPERLTQPACSRLPHQAALAHEFLVATSTMRRQRLLERSFCSVVVGEGLVTGLRLDGLYAGPSTVGLLHRSTKKMTLAKNYGIITPLHTSVYASYKAKWATRCMKRNGLSIRTMFGEAGSVSRTAALEGRAHSGAHALLPSRQHIQLRRVGLLLSAHRDTHNRT